MNNKSLKVLVGSLSLGALVGAAFPFPRDAAAFPVADAAAHKDIDVKCGAGIDTKCGADQTALDAEATVPRA
jgi:hypothetical protein